MTVIVVYESTMGRTKIMAEAICKGVQKERIECKLIRARDFTGIDDACALAIGSSTRMKRPLPKIRQIIAELPKLQELPVSAFGSYGWSGEAPRIIADRLIELGGVLVGGEPLRVKEHPKEEDIERCIQLGKFLAEKCK